MPEKKRKTKSRFVRGGEVALEAMVEEGGTVTGTYCNQRSRGLLSSGRSERRESTATVTRRTKNEGTELRLAALSVEEDPWSARLTDKRSNISNRSIFFLYTSILFPSFSLSLSFFFYIFLSQSV